ncbi:hypothetical protein GE300_03605 [Rhodobacteraceae bacterium 2CG4]|uniref:DUF1468 domain-containing protein n=1 Tax=Halovulum marinum TaxID=2662447 RepID=A0A6L5YY11_9RHOB|nr:tripartite tricarboxylate transporter TctB family protein [Halovulum marinum]MSU88705.1 hypothetical protein [Halovulum marinum]
MEHRPVTEIGVSAFVAAICAVFFVQASRLPPGSFEPLGSGPVPKWTAAIVILCCIAVMARGILRLRAAGGLAASAREEFTGGRPGGAVLMLAGSVLYVALLHFKVASFGIVTFVFLTLLIWALEGLRPAVLLPALVTAAVAAFGAEYLFTNVFTVDLPE